MIVVIKVVRKCIQHKNVQLLNLNLEILKQKNIAIVWPNLAC
jgi:hypothetical protein